MTDTDHQQAQFQVQWWDSGREPQCPPDPRFPQGVDVRVHRAGVPVCTAYLPYPAKRCGMYTVECRTCGIKVGVTTAGRPDDPRSVEIACHRRCGNG